MLGRDSGLKVCEGDEMPKIKSCDYGIRELVGRDYGIEKPYLGLVISHFKLLILQ